MNRSSIVVPPGLDVPPDFRAGVERAVKVLEIELIDFEGFGVQSKWTFHRDPDGLIRVYLDILTTFGSEPTGVTGYPNDPDTFVDEAHIKHGLRRPIWAFSQLIGHINKLSLRSDIRRLDALSTVGGE